MKKTTPAIITALIAGIAQAEYTIKIPLEYPQGGSLPTGTIIFDKSSIPNDPIIDKPWIATDPIITEWIASGEAYDCTLTPKSEDIYKGEPFTQTSTNCKQDQTRTVQQQETNTIETRAVGEPATENQTIYITETSTKEEIGTGTSWESFANAKNLPKTWDNLYWNNKNLEYIPYEPYPLTSINSLVLYNNQLTNVDALVNLTRAEDIYLQGNQLRNVSGLRNLTRISFLDLTNNQLTNVDGLDNLTSVDFLYLGGNPLTNINGLKNINAAVIQISANYSGAKLPANSIFCTSNSNTAFQYSFAQKPQLCEAQ